MELTVVGAGHGGLVTGACFASIGHRVRMLDVDRDRIDWLRAGSMPFFEPLLADLVTESCGAGRLTFHADASEALPDAQVAFICVGTPTSEDGRVDITSLRLAAEAFTDHGSDGALLVNRSTAPVGTAAYLRSLTKERRGDRLGIAVNPEFLAEGTAVHDFLRPDRIVIGTWDRSAAELVMNAYGPIIERVPPHRRNLLRNGGRIAQGHLFGCQPLRGAEVVRARAGTEGARGVWSRRFWCLAATEVSAWQTEASSVSRTEWIEEPKP